MATLITLSGTSNRVTSVSAVGGAVSSRESRKETRLIETDLNAAEDGSAEKNRRQNKRRFEWISKEGACRERAGHWLI